MLLICQNTLIYLCAILLLSTKNLTLSYDWPENVKITRDLSEALVEIISTLFVDTFHRRMFNFQVKVRNKNKEYSSQFDKIIDETMLLLNGNISILLKDGKAIPPDNERQFSVLLVDSSESLEFLYRDLNKFHLFVDGSYFIVLQTFPNIHHYYDELFEIFQLNWLNGITHADVLIHAVENVILLFHSMPFTPFHCKDIAPIIHNKFVNGRWLHKNFVTPKSKNLYGCPLVCATWEDMPYFQLDPLHAKGKSKYMGLEGKLLEYIAEKMNFTIKMRWLNNEEINQTVYDEQEVFRKLFTSNTDFVVGAFHYKPTSLEDPYAPTTAYYMSHYCFIVSAKTDAYDPFTKLLLPFEIEIWIILICIFVFVYMLLFLFMYMNRQVKSLVLGKENETPVYNMVVISLGGGVAKDPKIPFSRYLLVLWLLATFILRTVYQGYMFHYIKSDLHKPPPKSIADLLHKEYRIFMSDPVYASITDLPLLVAKAEVFNTSELESFEMLKHPKDHEPYKFVVLMALEYYGYYQFIEPINNDFYVVPEKLFTQQLSIYMKKNSAYLNRFNKYIKNYLVEGLMNRWERFLVHLRDSHSPKDDGPKPMKNFHLYAAYRLLFMGFIASLMAFFGEIFIFEMKALSRRYRKKNFEKRLKLKRGIY